MGLTRCYKTTVFLHLFEVKTDASDFAIAAALNQAGRPVAFFSRTLQGPETRHAAVEKEAQVIIETIRHWKHYPTGDILYTGLTSVLWASRLTNIRKAK